MSVAFAPLEVPLLHILLLGTMLDIDWARKGFGGEEMFSRDSGRSVFMILIDPGGRMKRGWG